MSDRVTGNILLCNRLHTYRRHNSRLNAELLESLTKSKRIHNRCKHTHVIGSCAVHCAAASSAPEVSASDNETNLNPHIGNLFNVCTNIGHHVKINSVTLLAGKNLTAELQQNSFIHLNTPTALIYRIYFTLKRRLCKVKNHIFHEKFKNIFYKNKNGSFSRPVELLFN